MNTLKAKLLVADPNLPDSNFYKTVVFMIQHDEEGAFGIVLNRPSDIKLKDIWQELSDHDCESEELINLGGPVSGPLLAIHTHPLFSEGEILPGVYIATQKGNLDAIVEQNRRPYRIYSGYSGWGKGQLENELKCGGWLEANASYDHIFAECEDLWHNVAGEIGQKIILSHVSERRVPVDPSVN